MPLETLIKLSEESIKVVMNVENMAALHKIIHIYTSKNHQMFLTAEYALRNVLPLLEQPSLKLTPCHL